MPGWEMLRGICNGRWWGKEKRMEHAAWRHGNTTPREGVRTAKGDQPEMLLMTKMYGAALSYTHTPAGKEQSCSGCLFPLFLSFFLSFSFSLLLSSLSKTKMFPQMHWSPSNRSLCFVSLSYFFFVRIHHLPRLSTGCLIIRDTLACSAKTLHDADTERSFLV